MYVFEYLPVLHTKDELLDACAGRRIVRVAVLGKACSQIERSSD